MTRRPLTLLAALGLTALVAGVLAGCATGAPDSGSTSPGGNGGTGDTATEIEVDAAWLNSGSMIGLVTQGSSTCVPTAGDVALEGAVLKVALVEPPADTACTRDLVPRATLVALPEGVDPTQDLEIEVTGAGYYGDTDLDGVPGLAPATGDEFLPSAGWTDEDGQFVILTWGSSSCVPVVESATASGPAEVTVTFATPPADQVCTMDMAPRGSVAWVDGLDDDTDVFAVLTGAEFDNVRIPIIGSD
ncbi:hypothetical protein [Microbacterium sp. 2FI]|uniref:hypothetical protein n=1 Tax=Microbacterium sp. 2FI TaxID=2502193 RepID=UPI0010F67771|nr:hypothetical protein [Microbacterium sp. 2FI]